MDDLNACLLGGVRVVIRMAVFTMLPIYPVVVGYAAESQSLLQYHEDQ